MPLLSLDQYHTPSSVRAEAQEKMKSIGSFTSQNAVDYDGFVELVMPDLQCYENARKGRPREYPASIVLKNYRSILRAGCAAR